METADILSKAVDGRRISSEEAEHLFSHAPLSELCYAANLIREKKHGSICTFIIDRNINYTNICEARCRFCAFSRDADDPDAYVLDVEEILMRVKEAVELGATQVMIQGGLYRQTGLDYIEKVFRSIKQHFPAVTIHSLTATEIDYFARISGLTVEQVLERLKGAGLNSLPGGGAEILVDSVRSHVSPKKISSRRWLEIHEAAHRTGMRSTATMVIGMGETSRDRVLHLARIRELQDRTGGFLSFIPWIYYPGNTALGGLKTTAADYLRTLAISRIFLDNIDHVQASWLTVGKKVAQMGLHFGADDLGSVMLEENVVKATGHRVVSLKVEEMRQMIAAADRIPVQRDTEFNYLEDFQRR